MKQRKTQPTSTLLARIIAHKEFIVTEVLDLKNKNVVPTRKGRIGTVILDTKRVGFSEEALVLLEKVRRGQSSMGDVDWFETQTEDGTKFALSWLGPINRIFHAPSVEGSRDYRVRRDACTIVPNEVTPEMLKAIEESNAAWKEPVSL